MFIYCDFDQRANQTSLALISSLTQQLLQQHHGDLLTPEILSLYKAHHANNTRPTLVEMTKNLKILTSQLSQVNIVIDALDECSEREEEALDFISILQQSLGDSIKIISSSRPPTSLQSAFFAKWEEITVSAHESDVRLYVEGRINQRHRLQRHIQGDPPLQDEILSTIVNESQGM